MWLLCRTDRESWPLQRTSAVFLLLKSDSHLRVTAMGNQPKTVVCVSFSYVFVVWQLATVVVTTSGSGSIDRSTILRVVGRREFCVSYVGRSSGIIEDKKDILREGLCEVEEHLGVSDNDTFKAKVWFRSAMQVAVGNRSAAEGAFFTRTKNCPLICIHAVCRAWNNCSCWMKRKSSSSDRWCGNLKSDHSRGTHLYFPFPYLQSFYLLFQQLHPFFRFAFHEHESGATSVW